MALKMAASAVLWWRRLFEAFPRPGLAVLIGRFSERFSRGQERGKRSSWLLLAPLLTQSVPQVTVQKSPPCCLCPEGTHRFQWIGNLVPEFGISSSQVQVLSSPMEFYDVMKAQIKLAKRRVILASLYLGTGPMEQALVDSMQETLESSQSSSLRVSVLLDFTRGSRGMHFGYLIFHNKWCCWMRAAGKNNSRTMLLPLLQKFPGQVQVSLFHTPNLRGLLRCLLPERFNETIGLQHIKVYVFDENVLLSGANLSDSYFTNRQDRYVLLQGCLEVADFFTELVEAIGDVSLQLQPDDTVFVKEGMLHPYQGDKGKYCRAANKRIMEVVNSFRARQCIQHTRIFHTEDQEAVLRLCPGGNEKAMIDTWIYPLLQMKPFGIEIDELVTETLLTEAEKGSRVYLSTGYFNLTQTYMALLLGTRTSYQILLASPEVNGFFGAKGVAGAIPAAYVHIAQQFYNKVCLKGQQERICLQEYCRKNWTFHAKGLWLYQTGSSLPCLTLIGSPNFGYRSVHRDLEAQTALVTTNQELQEQLHQEQNMLYSLSNTVLSSTFEQPDRYVKLWVKLLTPLIKNFF